MGKNDDKKPRIQNTVVHVNVLSDEGPIAGASVFGNSLHRITNTWGVVSFVFPLDESSIAIIVDHPGYEQHREVYSIHPYININIHLRKSVIVIPEFPYPSRHSLAIRSDFLTLLLANGKYASDYIALNEAERVEAVSLHHARKYDDMFMGTTFGGGGGISRYDYLDAPDFYVDTVKELRQQGIRTICAFGFEDDRDAQDKYRNEANLLAVIKDFVQAADEHVSCYLIGIEASEYWSYATMLNIAETVRKNSVRNQGVHLGQGEWGPNKDIPWIGNKRELDWWREYKNRTAGIDLAMFLQYRYDGKSDKFLCTDQQMYDWTKDLLDNRLDTIDVKLVAAEYAHGVPEEKAVRAGNLAMTYGAFGFMNGGTVND